jgi:hypothetical protein
MVDRREISSTKEGAAEFNNRSWQTDRTVRLRPLSVCSPCSNKAQTDEFVGTMIPHDMDRDPNHVTNRYRLRSAGRRNWCLRFAFLNCSVEDCLSGQATGTPGSQ